MEDMLQLIVAPHRPATSTSVQLAREHDTHVPLPASAYKY